MGGGAWPKRLFVKPRVVIRALELTVAAAVAEIGSEKIKHSSVTGHHSLLRFKSRFMNRDELQE